MTSVSLPAIVLALAQLLAAQDRVHSAHQLLVEVGVLYRRLVVPEDELLQN